MKIYSPIVEYLHLQIRFNLRTRCVEIKTSEQTEDIQSLQKAGKDKINREDVFSYHCFSLADFIKAFALGFDVDDALALIRLDDLFLESFEVNDGKQINHFHLIISIFLIL